MDMQNDQNFLPNLATKAQEGAQTNFTNPPAEPNTEDMELNEEQLDIISGGAEGFPVIRVG